MVMNVTVGDNTLYVRGTVIRPLGNTEKTYRPVSRAKHIACLYCLHVVD